MDSPSKVLKELPLINHLSLASELVWRSLLDLEIRPACAASIARVVLASAALYLSPPLRFRN